MDTPINAYRDSRRAALVGVIVSLGLGLLKLVGGLFGHSLGLVSDAVHSLVDAAISVALLMALTVAQRPPDKEHPYGHGRVEAVAGAGVALILLAVAAMIAFESVSSMTGPYQPPSGFVLVIAGGSAILQELLFRYMSRVARRTGSTALLGTAWDYRLDALGAISVMIGVGLARWADLRWADHAAAVLIALMVLWIGGRLLWENLQSLIDRQAGPEILQPVRTEAEAVPGVLAIEKLRVRRMGIEHIAEIHVQVDANATVRGGHDIAHAVKDRVVARVPSVSDVIVHVEPYGVDEDADEAKSPMEADSLASGPA